MRLKITILSTATMGVACPAVAAENVTYTYDALGRLVTTQVSSGPNANLNTTVSYDPAGNRSGLVVTGSNNPGSKPVAVIPITPPPTVIPVPNPNNR